VRTQSPTSWFYNRAPRGVVVRPVTRLHARWALSPRGLRHRVVAARAAWLNGEVRYWGAWLCGDTSTNITLLRGDEPAGRTCVRCDLRERFPAKPVVYRAFDADGALLYIGSTGDLGARLYGHRCSSAWWPKHTALTFDEYPTLNAARAAEAEAIATEYPEHNKIGRRDLVACS
jgi:hypothetical protein